MNKHAPTAIEIEALAWSTLTVPVERGEPVSHDGGPPSKPETRRRAALQWFIDTLAIAGAGMAGVHVDVGLDQSIVSDDQTGRNDRPDWKREATK